MTALPRRVVTTTGWHRLRRRRAAPAERGPLDFETFFQARFRGLVRLLVVSEAVGIDDAEDAVGDAMKDAFSNWETIENPEAWVRRAARNALITTQQRERRGRHLAAIAFLAAMPPPVRDLLGMAHEEAQEVVEYLERLPPAQRQIMALRVDDFTPAEIAELVGKDPQTVRSNLRAARQALAAMIRSASDEQEGRSG
jgi:RNA polymerase sigma factor (sigma-70 family)